MRQVVMCVVLPEGQNMRGRNRGVNATGPKPPHLFFCFFVLDFQSDSWNEVSAVLEDPWGAGMFEIGSLVKKKKKLVERRRG